MIRSILLALALVAGVASVAQAQGVQALPSCGTASLPLGPGARLSVDATTGNLCTNGGSSSGGSVTTAGTNGATAQAVQGITNGIPQNVNAGTDGSTTRALRTTTTGALEPPTAAAGKITQTRVASITANTSTQLVAANANRIAIEIQCDGTAPVGVDRTGGTLTDPLAAPLVIPSGSYPLYTMPIASLTAITAYTATAQTCRVTEYLR